MSEAVSFLAFLRFPLFIVKLGKSILPQSNPTLFEVPLVACQDVYAVRGS
jgi:hypothetical protein